MLRKISGSDSKLITLKKKYFNVKFDLLSTRLDSLEPIVYETKDNSNNLASNIKNMDGKYGLVI